MNRKQKAYMVVGFALLIFSLLFPPVKNGGYYGMPMYGFLFTMREDIGFPRLAVEWVLIALVSGGLFYSLRGSGK